MEDKPQNLPEFALIEKITKLMDSAFRIPGTNIRFGLDPILGLIPGIGEVVPLTISSILALTMIRHGANTHLLFRMAGNILLDFIVGSIPVLGDIFDFGYKANTRNYQLLQKYYKKEKPKPVGMGLLIIFGVLLLSIIIGSIWLFFWLIGILFNL